MTKINNRTLLFIIAVCTLFLFTREFLPLYEVNQNEYYVHGFARAHEDLLQTDLFVQTMPKHIVFSVLVEGLYRLNVIEVGSYAIQAALEALFYISTFLISQTIFTALARRNPRVTRNGVIQLSLLVVAILLVMRDSTLINSSVDFIDARVPGSVGDKWHQIWDLYGLADQYILSGYLQASEFGILIMLAIALSLRDYWRIAAVLLAIAVNFHFSYSIHAGVLMLVFAGWLIVKKERFLAFQILAIFGLMVVPVTLYAVSFLNDPLGEFANNLYAIELWPNHGIPAYFWRGFFSGNTLKMIVMVTSILLCLRLNIRLLTVILVTGFTFVTLGILYVHFTADYSVAMLFPWRASVYLVPLASIIIIVVFVWICSLKPGYDNRLQKMLLYLLIALVFAEGFASILKSLNEDQEPGTQQRLYSEIVKITGKTDVLLLPLEPVDDWESARLTMGRAIYVDHLCVPMLGEELKAWWDRHQFARAFFEAPLNVQLERCQEANIDYFVTDATDATIDIAPELQVDDFYLYACQ